MTRLEFYALCTEATISPELVMENENIIEALKKRDDEKVKLIIETEF